MVIGVAKLLDACVQRQLSNSSGGPSSKLAWSQAPTSHGFSRVGTLIASLLRDDGVSPSSTMNFAMSSSCLLEIASHGEGWT